MAAVITSGPSYFTVPSGTTAERPSTPVEGMFRYNTTLTAFEYWNGTLWVQINFPIVA